MSLTIARRYGFFYDYELHNQWWVGHNDHSNIELD